MPSQHQQLCVFVSHACTRTPTRIQIHRCNVLVCQSNMSQTRTRTSHRACCHGDDVLCTHTYTQILISLVRYFYKILYRCENKIVGVFFVCFFGVSCSQFGNTGIHVKNMGEEHGRTYKSSKNLRTEASIKNILKKNVPQ